MSHAIDLSNVSENTTSLAADICRSFGAGESETLIRMDPVVYRFDRAGSSIRFAWPAEIPPNSSTLFSIWRMSRIWSLTAVGPS